MSEKVGGKCPGKNGNSVNRYPARPEVRKAAFLNFLTQSVQNVSTELPELLPLAKLRVT
jgi:hypothetical protein